MIIEIRKEARNGGSFNEVDKQKVVNCGECLSFLLFVDILYSLNFLTGWKSIHHWRITFSTKKYVEIPMKKIRVGFFENASIVSFLRWRKNEYGWQKHCCLKNAILRRRSLEILDADVYNSWTSTIEFNLQISFDF